MKTDTSFPSSFLFNPEMSITAHWPTVRRAKARPAPRLLPLATETQIEYKQEFICGAILVLCVLFGLAACVAQFVLA